MNSWIFHQDWWLDAVAPGRWQRIEVIKGGIMVAALPVIAKQRFGLTGIGMPPLTQFLGPWIAPAEPGTKYPSYIGQQIEWLDEIIKNIPPHVYFSQKFYPSTCNWLPFYWSGFEATVRYTYILNDLIDLEKVKKDFQENIRRDIKKAEKQLVVRQVDDTRGLMEVNRRAFARLGQNYPYSESVVSRVFEACRSQNAGRILLAEDAQQRVHAALFYVWDDGCTYYVIGGGDPELRNSGATSLLMWYAIQHASHMGTRFDFEGSMLKPVERFVRAFGGAQTTYLHVTRGSKTVHLLKALLRSAK